MSPIYALLYYMCVDYIILHDCKVWRSVVSHVPPSLLLQHCIPWLNLWTCLLMQPAFIAIDSSFLLKAVHQRNMVCTTYHFHIACSSLCMAYHQLTWHAVPGAGADNWACGTVYFWTCLWQAWCQEYESHAHKTDMRQVSVLVVWLLLSYCINHRTVAIVFRCVGYLLSCMPLHLPEHIKSLEEVTRLVEFHLRAKVGTQRLGIGLILSYWTSDIQVS